MSGASGPTRAVAVVEPSTTDPGAYARALETTATRCSCRVPRLRSALAADPLVRWFSVIGAIVTAAVGVGLFALRRSLSLRLASAAPDQAPQAGTIGIQAAAISIVGIYFLAAGLSGLLREIVRSLLPHSTYSASLSIDTCAGPIAEVQWALRYLSVLAGSST